MAKMFDKCKLSIEKCKEKLVNIPADVKKCFSDVKVRFDHKQLMRYRRNFDFVNVEMAELDERYGAKVQKQKNLFVKKANSKLSKPAFYACDKAEYIEFILAEKLKKYDKQAWMKYRALNHGTAKDIFKAVKNGEGWDEILVQHRIKYEKLLVRRECYVQKLNEEKEKFLAKFNVANGGRYDELRDQLEEQYSLLSVECEEKAMASKEKRLAKLTEKAKKLHEKVDEYTTRVTDRRGMAEDVVLSVRNLKMYFGGLKAVDDLSFDVKRGEIFGLIGPNGAGKTTVFNCITRFYNATAGDMYFENKHGEVVDLRDFKVHDVILQGITRTFQNIELVKEISVLENLLVACTRSYRTGIVAHALGLPLLKKEEKIFRQKAMRILKFMGLENYAGWYAMGLPYGVLKKAEIARALMGDAKLIIMDEPAAGLNDAETRELTATIRKIRDAFGVTILLVEHDMGLVMDVCDTVYAISFGQMLAIGTTEEIQKNRAVQEAYLGVEEENNKQERAE